MDAVVGHFDRAREFQEYFQNAVRNLGDVIPGPVLGQETANNYCRRILTSFQDELPRKHPLKKAEVNQCKSDALRVLTEQITEAFVAERNNPSDLEAGELRPVRKYDSYGQYLYTDFVGNESFVKAMGLPGRYFTIHDERTKSWNPVSPDEFRRRCYDVARQRGVTLGRY